MSIKICRLLLRKRGKSCINLSYNRNLSNIITSGLRDVEIPGISVADFTLQRFSNYEDKIATECSVTGRRYTYGELREKIENLSRALRTKLRLNKGDVVAILLPNIPEFPIATLGVLKAGLVVTSINPVYTAAEVSKQLTDSSAKAIITLNEFANLAAASIEPIKKQLPILTIKNRLEESTVAGTIDFSELCNNKTDGPGNVDLHPDDLAFLPYSSGTTGLPKGVRLSHRNIVANLCQLEHPEIVISEISTATEQDTVPVVLPMFHIYGFTVNMVHCMRLGNKLVTLPKFTPELYISVLRNYKPQVLYMAPPIAIFLGNHPKVSKDDLSSIRTVMSGAAPLGALDEAKLLNKAEKEIIVRQGYGLSETSPLVTCTRVSFLKDPNASGTIGLPCSNTELKIVSLDDPEGKPLGPNESGELLVRGPQVMEGYHNRPEESKNSFLDGWFRTGDQMVLKNGYLIVKDRIKELIKVKGYQVAPAELEELLRDFPNVGDAAVIGVPHKTHGEIPRAYIVPKNATEKIDIEKLHHFVGTKLAPYKQLKGGVTVVDTIPKNASGKILRRQLKLEYEQQQKNA